MLAASPLRAADAATPKTVVLRVDPRTGKLVRREITPRPPAPPPAAISGLVQQSAKAHDVDPLLVQSIIEVESGYNPHAVSPKGAEGLMQLTPPTARMLGVGNTFNPGENIEAGVKYLKYLQDLYKDDRLALAAYNAGPGAVEKYKQIPPYQETRQYVDKVGKRYDAAKAAAEKNSTQPGGNTELAAPSPEPRQPRLEQFVDENGRLHLRTVP